MAALGGVNVGNEVGSRYSAARPYRSFSDRLQTPRADGPLGHSSDRLGWKGDCPLQLAGQESGRSVPPQACPCTDPSSSQMRGTDRSASVEHCRINLVDLTFGRPGEVQVVRTGVIADAAIHAQVAVATRDVVPDLGRIGQVGLVLGNIVGGQ